MKILLRAEELYPELYSADPSDDSDAAWDVSADLAQVRKLWCKILLASIHDHATSIHYHSRKRPCVFSYVSGQTVEVFAELPEHVLEMIFPAACSLFTAPATSVSAGGHDGSGMVGATCGSIEFDIKGMVFDWDVVVWSSGDRCGVELFERSFKKVEGSREQRATHETQG